MATEDVRDGPGAAAGADHPATPDAPRRGRDDGLAAPAPHAPDPWSSLRRFTSARIALGRAGGSLPTAELLGFALDHAEARDAVTSRLDRAKLEQDLAPLGLPTVALQTQADDLRTYLQRPDLGRALSPDGLARLSNFQPGEAYDVSISIADGLSALAAQRHAPTLLRALVPQLQALGLKLAPLALVNFGRVAVMDAIGSALRARLGLILIGERPGLGTADSLGAYLVFSPSPGKTDADRNCVSNIRPQGLSPAAAAETIAYIIGQCLRKQISGVAVKDERRHIPQMG